ncbi:LDLR chaperone boca-like [Mytilus galloprovincialis]|uniref:LDLR chaperone boca-like n=1 Tax=Mytilus galloprovincialis TaxID=29158 RepID=UPI003F7B5CAE
MVEKGGNFQFYIIIFIVFNLILLSICNKADEKETKNGKDEKWKKKNIRDYSEADLERLFDQWEDNDEDELEEDELPEWKREPPKIDMSKLDPSKPEEMIKMSKKGKTLMMFATVSENPSEKETEKITLLWHTSLFNAHIDTQRYVVGSNRVIFMLTDGSKAWEVKDFLTQQERCEEVTIEGKSYPGKGQKSEESSDKKNNVDSSKNKIKDKSKSESESSKKSTKENDIDDNRTGRKKTEL